MIRHRMAVALVTATLVCQAQPAVGYLKFTVRANSQQVTLKWIQTPVRYFVTGQGVPGVGPADFQATIGRAFATWQAVPSASITYQFGGVTAAQPLADDGQSTLGFQARPDLDRVLAATSFLIDRSTGALIESDIFFNSAFAWSVAAAGETGRYDLESVAVHEIGHLSGLSHSALGETEPRAGGGRRVLAAESVMFPIAFAAGNISDRTLRDDDAAGISDLYPEAGFTEDTGSVSGRVTKNGQGIFGAHITAFNPATGALVGTFSLNAQGEFSIAGLSPGPHVMRVEPLDDADLDSFFNTSSSVDVAFRPAFFDRFVIVPRGGNRGSGEIKVEPK